MKKTSIVDIKKKLQKNGNKQAFQRMQDDVLLDPSRKARFQENKQKIAQWIEQMHKQAKYNVIQKLNIEQLYAEENAKNSSDLTAVNNQSASLINFFSTTAKEPNNQKVVQPENIATFAEMFNFDYLCQANIAKMPVNETLKTGEVEVKLNDFINNVQSLNEHLFMIFYVSYKEYDDLLLIWRSAEEAIKPEFRKVFNLFRDNFIKTHKVMLELMVEIVTNLSLLIAYLENNPGLGIEIHKGLEKEYLQTHSLSLQLKKSLIERCSPNICAILEIKANSNESIIEKVKSILTNKALSEGNEKKINRFVF